MAFANGYTYRRSIAVDNTKVSGTGDLTDYPVLIKGTYAYLATTANGGGVENASGYDVIFTSDSAGSTQLKHEVERWINTTGEVIYWVKIPTLDGDADTTFYMFYGNSSVSTDQSDKNNVWRSEYKVVAHLQETGAGTSNEYIDSTANANHGTGGVGTTNVPDRVTGKIGYAQQFDDATTDGIDIADHASLDLAANTDGTISLWVKESGSGSSTWEVLFAKRTAATCNYQAFLWENSQDISWQNDGNATRGTQAITTTYKKLGFVIDGTANTVTVYINGASAQTMTSREFGTTNTAALTLGYWLSSGTPAEFLSADIEEFRLYHGGKLSGDWLATEYANENDPSTFYAVGAEETNSATSVKDILGSGFIPFAR